MSGAAQTGRRSTILLGFAPIEPSNSPSHLRRHVWRVYSLCCGGRAKSSPAAGLDSSTYIRSPAGRRFTDLHMDRAEILSCLTVTVPVCALHADDPHGTPMER